MNFIVGLTGPTGAGKSSVTNIAKDLGFKVIDCDRFARIAVQKGSDGLADVVSAFGQQILNADGTLNRAELARAAFSSPDKTELLNKTLLPHIVKLIKAQIDAPLVLLDAPTLFESGADSMCNLTIAVLSDKTVRKKRIIERDGIDNAAATLRINAGKSDEFYIKKADNIIYNNGEQSVFETQISTLLNQIRKENENV